MTDHATLRAFLFCLVCIAVVPRAAHSQLIPVDEIEGPVCVVRNSSGDMCTLSPLVSQYNILIADGFAHIRLTQLYVNMYEDVNDIVYVFPLPHEGSVHAMSMEYRDSLYRATIREKEEAIRLYDSLLDIGAIAALLLQDKPNVFQQRLANIAVGESAYVQIELSMPLRYAAGTYELAVPTMVADRYQSSGAAPVPSAGAGMWNPPEDRDGQSLQINVLLQTGFPITNISSPTHPLDITTFAESRSVLEGRKVVETESVVDMEYSRVVMLTQVQTYPNRDYVLRFSRVNTEKEFSVASYYDPERSKGFFAANIYPDLSALETARPDLEIVLLIDISGSQSGWPLAKEKEISHAILERLLPTDRLTVLSFNTSVQWAFGSTEPVAASATNIAAARAFVDGLGSSGGTDILGGVRAALSAPQTDEHVRYYIFLTDGFVTNEEAIFEEIKNHPSQPTVFTFGAGDNLNRYFLDEAARIGNGFSTEITQYEAVEPKVEEAWSRIEGPQMTNISIGFDGLMVSDLIGINVTRLYSGLPITIYGTYASGGPHTVTVEGLVDGQQVTLSRQINFAQHPNLNTMLPQIWARQMIEQLMIDQGTSTANKDRIIDLSMDYQVLCQYTAFLAMSAEAVPDGGSIGAGLGTEAVADHTAVLKRIVVCFENGFLKVTFPTDEIMHEISVFDLSGRLVFRYVNTSRAFTREFRWDGRQADGRMVRAGKYVVRIVTNRGIIVKPVRLGPRT
jgi:Ca-activated chloride channel family protein